MHPLGPRRNDCISVLRAHSAASVTLLTDSDHRNQSEPVQN